MSCDGRVLPSIAISEILRHIYSEFSMILESRSIFNPKRRNDTLNPSFQWHWQRNFRNTVLGTVTHHSPCPIPHRSSGLEPVKTENNCKWSEKHTSTLASRISWNVSIYSNPSAMIPQCMWGLASMTQANLTSSQETERVNTQDKIQYTPQRQSSPTICRTFVTIMSTAMWQK